MGRRGRFSMNISGFSQSRSGVYWQEQVAAEHDAWHRRYFELPRRRPVGEPPSLADHVSAYLSDVSDAREPGK